MEISPAPARKACSSHCCIKTCWEHHRLPGSTRGKFQEKGRVWHTEDRKIGCVTQLGCACESAPALPQPVASCGLRGAEGRSAVSAPPPPLTLPRASLRLKAASGSAPQSQLFSAFVPFALNSRTSPLLLDFLAQN